MENFKTWQEYFEKMKSGTDDAMGNLRSRSADLMEGFKSGYAAAREKTSDALEKEYTPLEKGLILGGVLFIGVLIGMCIGAHRRKKKEEAEDEE